MQLRWKQHLTCCVHCAQIAMREQQVLWYYYWHRLAGCALSWFFWDVSFYGNKLFQSTFIKILYPGASILTTLEWTLLNSAVSLVRSLLQAPLSYV